MNVRSKKGITLISLIVTIIILIILATISINIIIRNGLFNKTQLASDETKKSQATETMNLKITNIQISSYTESQELPNLQYLADKLCEDEDMEYVLTASKAQASLEKIDVTNFSSIYTKLKDFPYEFEINSSLQLASIDGVKVANNPTQIPEGYIKPEGTIQITKKSKNIDVSNYQYADTSKLYTEDEVSSGKGLYWETGTGTFSAENFFSVNHLNFSPNEIWLYAVKDSISGKLIVHATKDYVEFWATTSNQNYYGIENNFSITSNGFNYTATGWSNSTIRWTATI